MIEIIKKNIRKKSLSTLSTSWCILCNDDLDPLLSSISMNNRELLLNTEDKRSIGTGGGSGWQNIDTISNYSLGDCGDI